MITQLAARGQKHMLVVPIAFTSDHIETLSEIDIESGALAHSLGMTGFRRALSLNARPEFLDALADIVNGRLSSRASRTVRSTRSAVTGARTMPAVGCHRRARHRRCARYPWRSRRFAEQESQQQQPEHRDHGLHENTTDKRTAITISMQFAYLWCFRLSVSSVFWLLLVLSP